MHCIVMYTKVLYVMILDNDKWHNGSTKSGLIQSDCHHQYREGLKLCKWMCWLTQWQGWLQLNLYWPDIWASTLCNNTFTIGWWHFDASRTPNNLRLINSTGFTRIEHLNNKLEGNAAEWYSICCRGKVLNLQGYSIQASCFISCVQKVALEKKN